VTAGVGRQPGTTKILRNHGVRDLQGGGYGNLIITFQVYVPSSLSEEQKRLISQVFLLPSPCSLQEL